MTGVGEAMAAINLDDEMTAEERAERAAREAAEMEAIARDWNRFDKEELVREFGDVAAKPYTLALSKYSKPGASYTVYDVSIEPKASYAAITRKCTFKVLEGVAGFFGFSGVLLSYFSGDGQVNGSSMSYDSTEGQLAATRAESGYILLKRYFEVLPLLESVWDARWRLEWEDWRDHVRRALFAFFRGGLIDARKLAYRHVYKLERADWLAYRHRL